MTDRPQFKSVRQQAAELAAYAGSHTPEETRARLAALSPTVRRKIIEAIRAEARRQQRNRRGKRDTGIDGISTAGMVRLTPRREDVQR
jgi:hypothetical protein